jgi:antitoxin (DNA-binding transcriptional repressor) of toxin-antitoxin stability system
VKTIDVVHAGLDTFVDAAREERVVLTREGKPVALLIGLDEEQQDLGSSGEFWNLVTERRRQRTLSREELEQRVDSLKTSS